MNLYRTKIVNLLNNTTFRCGFELAKELSTAVAMYKEKPNKWKVASAGASMISVLSKHYSIFPWDYFDTWDVLLNKEFSSFLSDILVKNFKYEEIVNDDYGVRLFNVNGYEVGHNIVANKKSGSMAVEKIYVKENDKEQVEDIIRDLIWKRFGKSNAIIRKNVDHRYQKNEDKMMIEIDEIFQPLHSDIAEEKAEFYKKCDKVGISRALLLYGPPGTGKSTMARSIVSKLGYRSFRVKLSDLGSLDSSLLFDCINAFRPDALILDDLDRAHCQDDLLETFEMLHTRVKLIVATANDTSKFDTALLRPGRFDDIELIEKLDDAVIKSVLGEDSLSLFEKVKDWPIGFIEDIRQRRKFQSLEEASKSIEELGRRVNIIQNAGPGGKGEWDVFSDENRDEDEDEDVDESEETLPF